jgi:fructose-1,6-bisphosphatase/sedoheptulose 1,7-bisphosphatase-like protein
MKELIEEAVSAIEEMGCVVVKGMGDVPGSLDDIIKAKGMFLYRPVESAPDGMIKTLIEKELDGVIEALLENHETRDRIVDALQEKGYQIRLPEKQDI